MNTKDMNAYLNNRGYVIFKDELSDSKKEAIVKELMVKPYVPKSIAQIKAYPVYRESVKKMYLPRFYGIDTFGNKYDIKISSGIDIDYFSRYVA